MIGLIRSMNALLNVIKKSNFMEEGEVSMAKKYLIVVDMQKDFVDGVLGSKEAVAIVPALLQKIEGFDGDVIFTYDTHQAD